MNRLFTLFTLFCLAWGAAAQSRIPYRVPASPSPPDPSEIAYAQQFLKVSLFEVQARDAHDEVGKTVRVRGELINTGDKTLNRAEILVELPDADGRIVHGGTISVDQSILRPGYVAPFEGEVPNTPALWNGDVFARPLSVNFIGDRHGEKDGSAEYARDSVKLEVVEFERRQGGNGPYVRVVGRATNTGERTILSLVAAAQLLDESGQPIQEGIDWICSRGKDLPLRPGYVRDFVLEVVHLPRAWAGKVALVAHEVRLQPEEQDQARGKRQVQARLGTPAERLNREEPVVLLNSKRMTAQSGYGVITGEIENVGDRALDQVTLQVWPSRKGYPSRTLEKRLLEVTTSDDIAGPLQPGTIRKFRVDLPIKISDDFEYPVVIESYRFEGDQQAKAVNQERVARPVKMDAGASRVVAPSRPTRPQLPQRVSPTQPRSTQPPGPIAVPEPRAPRAPDPIAVRQPPRVIEPRQSRAAVPTEDAEPAAVPTPILSTLEEKLRSITNRRSPEIADAVQDMRRSIGRMQNRVPEALPGQDVIACEVVNIRPNDRMKGMSFLTLKFSAKTDKAIRVWKGTVYLTDLFGDKVLDLSFDQGAIDRPSPIEMIGQEGNWTQLVSLRHRSSEPLQGDAKDFKAVVRPSHVLYENGEIWTEQ